MEEILKKENFSDTKGYTNGGQEQTDARKANVAVVFICTKTVY